MTERLANFPFETEIKFAVVQDRASVILDRLTSSEVIERHLMARYFDTPDLALSRHGVAVRLRQEGTTWVQNLKVATEGLLERLEHEVAIEATLEEPLLDLRRHQGTPAAAALREVLDKASVKASALRNSFVVEIRRTSRVVLEGASAIEVSLDQGVIKAQDQTMPVSEVEFELKAGSPQDLIALARRWSQGTDGWLYTASKAERGTRLASGAGQVGAAKAKALRIDADVRPQALLRGVVANALDQILTNATEVGAGSTDEDHVHQLRVGIRRMRTVLREMHDFANGIDPAWEIALKEAFVHLGAYRDRQTVVAQTEAQLDEAGAPGAQGETSVGGPGEDISPSAAVRSWRFQATLFDLLELAASSAPAQHEHSASTKDVLAERLTKLHRQVALDGARFTRLDVDAQHRVRKRLKRLRYLSEFASPVFGRKHVDRYLERLRPAQDELGSYNDEHVALDTYRPKATSDVRAAFAAGWLSGRHLFHAKAAQRALEKVSDAPRFWKKAERKRD